MYDNIWPNSSYNEKCSDINFKQYQHTHRTVQSVTSSSKSCRFQDNVKKKGRARYATDANTAHALGMLDK